MNSKFDENILNKGKEITPMEEEKRISISIDEKENSSMADDKLPSESESESETETEVETSDITSELERMRSSSNTIINIIDDSPKEVIYRKPRKEKRQTNFFKEFTKKRVYIDASVSILILGMIDLLCYLFINKVGNADKITLKKELDKNPRSTGSTVFLIIFVCILRPLLEEIVFRKFVFRISARLSRTLAYLLSSFLYAFAYFDCNFITLWHDMDDFIPYFLKGITLAATYDYHGLILSSIYSNVIYSSLLTLIQFL